MHAELPVDQPPVVAFTAFADAWPRAREMEIGAALCAGAILASKIWGGPVNIYLNYYSFLYMNLKCSNLENTAHWRMSVL